MAADDSSVSQWLDQLEAGDAAAPQKLWERYFGRLVGLARAKLGAMPRRAADEEDVALSAFNSFFQGVAQGRFPQLDDRDNLWRLLVTLTARKACQLHLYYGRHKRGGNAVLDEAALARTGSAALALEQFLARDPTPEFAAQAAEEYERLLASLQNPDWRALAQLKLEGYTNEEIATRLGCGLRSVERRLRLIRDYWTCKAAEVDSGTEM
jgi:DNA-directed RNA polymerase specialized sigma24 family protein